MSEADEPQEKPKVGRRRRLTIHQVVEAAAEIGLDKLSMQALAVHLGVGVGTLYNYVEDIGQLRRLVVVTMARRPPVKEEGQSWAEIARTAAASNFALLTSEPQLMIQIVSGAPAADGMFAELEHFISLLVARGFSAGQAFDLHRAILYITTGAATVASMAQVWEREGEPRAARLEKAFADLPDDAYPHLRSLGLGFRSDAEYIDYRPALERLLAQIAAERGEALPPPKPA